MRQIKQFVLFLKSNSRNNMIANQQNKNEDLSNQIEAFNNKFDESIKNLDEYVNLKSLWLNNNQITVIENLSSLSQLTSLNLQNNLITEIYGLDELVNLNSLMLSNNCIKNVSGLSTLKKLVTFEIDYNQVKTADSLKGILECPSISVLNIVHNAMDDPIAKRKCHWDRHS